MVCRGIYSYAWKAIPFGAINITLLVSPLAISGSYFLFVMSVSSDVFLLLVLLSFLVFP
jgi:hypothetical protein